MSGNLEPPMTDPLAGAPVFRARSARAWLERVWLSIAERGRRFAPIPAESIDPAWRARMLATSLLSAHGEASGAAVARELLAVLGALTTEERGDFYGFLSDHFQPDPARLTEAAQAYIAVPSPETAAILADCAEPPRQELLRRMNMAQGGTAALVALRRELPSYLAARPGIKRLDADLKHLFASWFNRGFLEIRRIDWQTPAAILEKLITYEAVHEIQGWADLRRRLAADRRCFAFFHPALPGEPLIFVEVALVAGLAASVSALLDRETGEAAQHHQADAADTAIFYSISNCQEGLRGISFGNFLIKQVVEDLRAELPALRQFATLSPVPGFRQWLEAAVSAEDVRESTVAEGERAPLLAVAQIPESGPTLVALRKLLADGAWAQAPALEQAVRPALLRLCALYLTSGGNVRGADPVARFHLGNGARLERINWMSNPTPRGLRESYGIMVNYLYDLATIEANHEAFIREGIVASSPAVMALLAPNPAASARRARGK